MKTAYLKISECKNNLATEENFKIVGNNSGNIVFENALINIIKCEPVERKELEERAWEFDNLVLRNLIWIRENEDLIDVRELMNLFRGKPIIPISVGLQAECQKKDFKLHENTIRILQELSDKAELVVRGYYTAEILNKYGIKNIRPVGCPSMYYGLNFNRKINKKDTINSDKGKILCNYRTLSKTLDTETDFKILHYLSKNAGFFMEQTRCYFNTDLKTGKYKEFMDFYRKSRKIFFRFNDWYKFIMDKEFCIGARFHGNVVPILAGVPALFIVSDSRTKELTEFFKFPTINIDKFRTDIPLQEYYDMADYSQFNREYASLLENFIDFCMKNQLELTSGLQQYYYRKFERIKSI